MEATVYERPMEVPDQYKVTTHSGVVVRTEKGERFLIHNTPESGVVATPAQNMSSKWKKGGDIEINGYKTVEDALQGGYQPGSAAAGKILPAKWGEYIGSGTCKWTASRVAKALQSE